MVQNTFLDNCRKISSELMLLDQCEVCINIAGISEDIMRVVEQLKDDLNAHTLYASVGIGCSLI